MKAHKQYGMTLIELMVALAIGAFLMIGAITVFMQSRTTFRLTESVARLQENARFALDTLEPDIRMAQYWGLTTKSDAFAEAARPSGANGIGDDTCGNNFLINLFQPVQGTNNSYGLAAGCPGRAPVETNADTLIVRHAAQDVAGALTPSTVYLQSTRGGIFPPRIFIGTTVPAGPSPTTTQINRLVVNAYYVSREATMGPTIPSLQVYRLQQDGTMANEEVIQGVEDFQFQFGVDTDLPDTADRGSIDRYVNPNDPMIDPTNAGFNANAVILAVRVWVRVRAEQAERGYVDTQTYTYADQVVGPFNDGFRRIVVSKTIYLRNSRPYS